ncbi:hypothetical protein J6590_089719 [Homalodisca vitripennis]|nr:hypothetical protein J6590_089719 [Homalodisca vitripennis]
MEAKFTATTGVTSGLNVRRHTWTKPIVSGHECNASYEFRCPNGRCIRRANLCDSQCDCVPPPSTSPGSDVTCADEVGCSDYYTLKHGIVVCEVGATLGCTVPSTQDSVPVKERCIRAEFLCDGHNDCQNGLFLSDEFGCEEKDFSYGDTFTCKDNRTLPNYLRCDFKPDCLHGDDELDCPAPECKASEFRCSSGQCVSAVTRCDLFLDCLDKSDELECAL